MMGLSYDQLDVSTEEMENVDLYMQTLGVPARRNVNDPQVIQGEENFLPGEMPLVPYPDIAYPPSWIGTPQ